MIPDTARLAAFHRARESARSDAVFRDPHARALAGEPDPLMARALAAADKIDWFYTARTYAIDRLVTREVADGADLVVQLAAGLDARPYRLDLPATLRWVEIDLPEVNEYKTTVLAHARPSCVLERLDVDLSNPDARRGAFASIARRSSNALVIAEGLLIHLMSAEVFELSRDLAVPASFKRWVADIASIGLLDALNETSGDVVRRAGAPYVFAPHEGPAFFRDDGWQVLGVKALLRTAARLERLPIALRLTAMLPERSAFGDRPWAGVCLLGRESLEGRVD